ncbi:hypothetical protein [Paenilisteria rocourtiae]|uniref:Lipoprotein n=1 Tax=Listeria rocourtiae TaxID=647910 RepID=A0A4R6ZHF1_9LIST|nr:hypothetical protein [Listeria rocourtiae]MBC1435407.1 hypothetical protein [Listeria rocourtiae]MBC1605435.1 hypothetical protein [Listeria rocourtiae]TDR51542.1 hypothetical protein DFP96_11228 [Listeria rocourtiae]
MEQNKILVIFTIMLVAGCIVQVAGALTKNNYISISGSVIAASGSFWLFFQLIRAKKSK